jgi:hypothetical protein
MAGRLLRAGQREPIPSTANREAAGHDAFLCSRRQHRAPVLSADAAVALGTEIDLLVKEEAKRPALVKKRAQKLRPRSSPCAGP